MKAGSLSQPGALVGVRVTARAVILLMLIAGGVLVAVGWSWWLVVVGG
jgi:hypothetical protein